MSFGIWFLGLFLTDFTAIVNTPEEGWKDVLRYISVISIIHIVFLLMFLVYVLFRHWTAIADEAPTWKMIVHSMFDMSLHLDVAGILFAQFFYNYSRDAIFILEALVVLDAFLTLTLTPFKRWRALIQIFGVLPTLVLGHVSLYRKLSGLLILAPLAFVLLCPLLFTISVIAFSRYLSHTSIRIIKKLDPSLLPNMMMVPTSHRTLESTDHPSVVTTVHRKDASPPSITEKATNGEDTDYVDFKSVPFAVAASFLIHFGCFASGMHDNTMVVMGHYFITLSAILVNTRVVAFPAIILTNVVDPAVQFNSVWPELSFV